MTPEAPNQAVLVDPTTGQLGSADVGSLLGPPGQQVQPALRAQQAPWGRSNRRYGRNRPHVGYKVQPALRAQQAPVGQQVQPALRAQQELGWLLRLWLTLLLAIRRLLTIRDKTTPLPALRRSLPIPTATITRPMVRSLSLPTPAPPLPPTGTITPNNTAHGGVRCAKHYRSARQHGHRILRSSNTTGIANIALGAAPESILPLATITSISAIVVLLLNQA